MSPEILPYILPALESALLRGDVGRIRRAA